MAGREHPPAQPAYANGPKTQHRSLVGHVSILANMLTLNPNDMRERWSAILWLGLPESGLFTLGSPPWFASSLCGTPLVCIALFTFPVSAADTFLANRRLPVCAGSLIPATRRKLVQLAAILITLGYQLVLLTTIVLPANLCGSNNSSPAEITDIGERKPSALTCAPIATAAPLDQTEDKDQEVSSGLRTGHDASLPVQRRSATSPSRIAGGHGKYRAVVGSNSGRERDAAEGGFLGKGPFYTMCQEAILPAPRLPPGLPRASGCQDCGTGRRITKYSRCYKVDPPGGQDNLAIHFFLAYEIRPITPALPPYGG
ncbi:hypothetical protein AURANDRAFT_68319 [Aureococcus anophagefferens]|uniref:Uncharacterized protein n=1 Tax=Aureococcus anophagefferens TaxID=44056 RepID=F0YP85_AURAN|nr:hypothetical protein AURANDRAFT_68319 [Aureococcus anophagefferens]EGB03074.1 hypothetical protein AURANDRAFT_68319 [Aureococcus anophagefferens]|eukprot:XP_009042227.1 hypothetical protein AURANDRAFT_68319 [Aureococcus anophagefferens]